ncbi:MAG TPA: tRNA (adenosine(37)-N6)-threonylcarbamoyltransferase complex dimerization subunit type 1 TsaB [Thermoanaerobaculaceae bacterium]|nr:tRNA (adenosine(37)-N6)-threonylcarbamoyltransferase complex dimerization subunit type 1 TsaB [Thermoanaerobaculaceae bacterium]
METVLAIAACGPRLELALAAPGLAAPGAISLAGPTPRSELVMAGVDLLLRAAGVERRRLEAVVATRGPGSFTGVRVALATASGLSLALGIPAHGFPSLLAQAARTDVDECLAVQPARRGFVYAQPFSRAGGRLAAGAEPRPVEVAALAESRLPVIGPPGVPLPEGTRVAPASCGAAEAMLRLLGAGESIETAELVPVYVDPPPAAIPTRTLPPWPPSPKAS